MHHSNRDTRDLLDLVDKLSADRESDSPTRHHVPEVKSTEDEGMQSRITNLMVDRGVLDPRAGRPLGPTGEYPDGPFNADDDGAIRIAIAAIDGKVVLHFGKNVMWMGFSPEQAVSMGSQLQQIGVGLMAERIRQADQAAKKREENRSD